VRSSMEISNPSDCFNLPKKETYILRRRTRASKVKTSIVVLAVILFIGVVLMVYGYLHNHSQITYLGLFITGATSLTILVQTLVSQSGIRGV
jgi:hypothetical protein